MKIVSVQIDEERVLSAIVDNWSNGFSAELRNTDALNCQKQW